jgi:hypothetical protein
MEEECYDRFVAFPTTYSHEEIAEPAFSPGQGMSAGKVRTEARIGKQA